MYIPINANVRATVFSILGLCNFNKKSESS